MKIWESVEQFPTTRNGLVVTQEDFVAMHPGVFLDLPGRQSLLFLAQHLQGCSSRSESGSGWRVLVHSQAGASIPYNMQFPGDGGTARASSLLMTTLPSQRPSAWEAGHTQALTLTSTPEIPSLVIRGLIQARSFGMVALCIAALSYLQLGMMCITARCKAEERTAWIMGILFHVWRE